MSSIDYSKLMSVTARVIVRALTADGFRQIRQIGSHRRFVHHEGRRFTVAFTKLGDTFEVRTLRSISIIERQAKWNFDDLRRLGLLYSHRMTR